MKFPCMTTSATDLHPYRSRHARAHSHTLPLLTWLLLWSSCHQWKERQRQWSADIHRPSLNLYKTVINKQSCVIRWWLTGGKHLLSCVAVNGLNLHHWNNYEYSLMSVLNKMCSFPSFRLFNHTLIPTCTAISWLNLRILFDKIDVFVSTWLIETVV